MDDISLAFDTPPGWFLVDDGSIASVAERVDAHVKGRKDLRPFRDLIVEAVEDQYRSRGRALVTGVRWDLTKERRPAPVFAYMTANVVDVTGFGDAGGLLERLAGALAERDPGDEVAPRVEPARLAAGDGLRREFVRAVGPRSTMRLVVEYYLPIGGGLALQVQFSSSNLAEAAVLVPEYDAIAASMAVQPAR